MSRSELGSGFALAGSGFGATLLLGSGFAAGGGGGGGSIGFTQASVHVAGKASGLQIAGISVLKAPMYDSHSSRLVKPRPVLMPPEGSLKNIDHVLRSGS